MRVLLGEFSTPWSFHQRFHTPAPLLAIGTVSEVHLKHLLPLLQGPVSKFIGAAVVHGVWALSCGTVGLWLLWRGMWQMNSALGAPSRAGEDLQLLLFLAVAQEAAGWCLCTNALAVPIVRRSHWAQRCVGCSWFWTLYLSGRVAKSGAGSLSIFSNKSPRKQSRRI